jgi:hypothetical protein
METVPVLPTTTELRRFRLTVIDKYWNPRGGMGTAWFAKLFNVTPRQIRFDRKDLAERSNGESN